MKKKLNYITFVVHPTQWNDYDILGIGDITLLKQLSRKEKGFDLIKKSKFGGIPILVMDTCDTLKDAEKCIRNYIALYRNEIRTETI